MNEAAVRKALEELHEVVANRHPAGQVLAAGEGLYVASHEGGEIDVEEALADLRVLLKYLVFDLEATKRENRYLRQMLESRRQNHDRSREPEDDPSV